MRIFYDAMVVLPHPKPVVYPGRSMGALCPGPGTNF